MTTLRILAYNVNSASPKRLERLHKLLDTIDADIIALTEADHQEVIEELAGRLGLQHVWAAGSGDRHVATLSRFPIEAWDIHSKPPLTQAALQTKLALPTRYITIFNIHFLPYLLLPFEVRRWQAVGRLQEIICNGEIGPHLIVGDLNAIGRGDRVLQRNNPTRMRRVMALQLNLIFRLAVPRLLRAGYTDCFRQLHPEQDGFTFMTGNPTTRYDYVIADKQFSPTLRTCQVVDDLPDLETLSDHFPLLAEFEIGEADA